MNLWLCFFPFSLGKEDHYFAKIFYNFSNHNSIYAVMISDDSDNKPVDCGTNTPVSEGMKRVKKKKKPR